MMSLSESAVPFVTDTHKAEVIEPETTAEQKLLRRENMGQKESSTSTETSNAEMNETNTQPKERRRSQHRKRNSRDVELKNLDQSGHTSHKNKGRKVEESNLNDKKQPRQKKSKSIATDLHMLGVTEQTKDKSKGREVKSLEEISMPERYRASFNAGRKSKSEGQRAKTLDPTKQRKKDLGVKFWKETDKPGLPLVDFNSDERQRSRQRKSKSRDHRDSKSLGPTTEKKQKSKVRRAKSLEDLSSLGQYVSSLDSDGKTQSGQRSPKSKDPDSKTSKDKAEMTIFNTYKALRLIDKQLERITKNQECLITLSRNIQSFKEQVKTIRSSTSERRNKLWDKYEDWQKVIQGFDYPLAHLGAMMNVDMNFLKRLKFLDYIIVSMDTLKESCRKLEKEKDISVVKHQEERKKLLDDRVNLEKVQKRLEDMFPAIKKKMRRKERESHRANKGTQTQSHYESSMMLSNLMAQIHTSFSHFAQNFQHLSL